MKALKITTLFLDIGGVLLTNGWDSNERNLAAAHFKLNGDELNERHHLAFDAYEEGKLTLHEYLARTVFYEKRAFLLNDFISFILEQSQPYQAAINYFKEIKKYNNLKIISVNNEGRELNAFRIKKYRLYELYDAFISSCFVNMRKPNPAIFNMAIDISQTPLDQILFIDDRLMFVEVAQSLGIHAIHYKGLEPTKILLEKFGIQRNNLVEV